MKDSNCIFCKIANGEIPSRTLYEDEKYRVILDLGPATRGHALVLPKEHSMRSRKTGRQEPSKSESRWLPV